MYMKNYYHFVRTILSIPFCPYHFVPYHFFRIPFCPYHFVRAILSGAILSGHPDTSSFHYFKNVEIVVSLVYDSNLTSVNGRQTCFGGNRPSKLIECDATMGFARLKAAGGAGSIKPCVEVA